jgi:hypothetical protein
MIGVVSKPTEIAVVGEFFQLFKTPWEFFREGRSYDVIVSTTDRIPETDARAILSYGSDTKASDREANIKGSSILHRASVDVLGERLPIYGDLLSFEAVDTGVLAVIGKSERAGIRLESSGVTVHRFGYDLFAEVAMLLATGQPLEHAQTPALELHIAIMRNSILDSGIQVLEIPPVPAGYDFTVCLTHDIDFVGIRRHKFDHTMWGFLYRSTLGALLDLARRKISFARLLKRFKAAALLPLVYVGVVEDYWMPFEWYLKVEKGLAATYFLIPFKNRPGDKVPVRHAERRATAYDVTDLPDWTARLINEGCEIGVHGLDAWHSVEKGREERERVSEMAGRGQTGIRMHWLLRDKNTFGVLEQAGYVYDSTAGYNETVGYFCGTHQVFRPLGARTLLELPLHIQDGALFYGQRLGLSEDAAWKLCRVLVQNARRFGGVLTVLWHDRSPGPERFWGEFYVKLVQDLKAEKVWFASAGQAVDWFRRRREVVFQSGRSQAESLAVAGSDAAPISPPLRVRVHRPNRASGPGRTGAERARPVDIAWDGLADIDLGDLLKTTPCLAATAHGGE